MKNPKFIYFLCLLGSILNSPNFTFAVTRDLQYDCCSIESKDSTGKANKVFPRNSVLLPVSLISSGLIIEALPANTIFSKERIQEKILKTTSGFSTSADNYLQYAPIVIMLGSKLGGLRSKSDLVNQLVITAKTEILVTTVVTILKHVVNDWRPDGGSNNSMPSGHTTQAFASAALLDMEYRHTSKWMSVTGYLMAAATGIFRVTNNRHWVPDVLVGAGIGIGSVKLVYATHKYRWGNSKPIVLIPSIYKGGAGIHFSMTF